MEPTQPMVGNWARELTDVELKKVLNAGKLYIAESDKMGIQFFASSQYLAIVRTGGLGGDAYNVHGGWKYANIVQFLKDWRDIKSIADRVSRWGKHSETD